MTKISIVSPIYNAEKILPLLIEKIELNINKITSDYEIILVDDGSPDNSWRVIEEFAKSNINLIGIKLSRNFGQHYAISAGLTNSSGIWTIVMDCDLQDDPEEFSKMYAKALEGYDIVLAQRVNRRDNFLKKLFSKLFYRTLGYLTGSYQDETIANYGLYHRKVIDAVLSMKESIKYFPTMIQWVGFNTTKINVTHSERLEGESSYNFKKLINLAVDIILAYSDKPIRLVIKFGLITSSIAFLLALFYLVKWIIGDVIVLGYTSLIISIWFLSGIIISILGIIGLYVGKTFEGVKKRPPFIINHILNDRKS